MQNGCVHKHIDMLLLPATQMSPSLLTLRWIKTRKEDKTVHAGHTDSSSAARDGHSLGILHLLSALGWLKTLGNGNGQYPRISLENTVDLSVGLEKMITPPQDYLYYTRKV